MFCMKLLFLIISTISGSRKFILYFHNNEYLSMENNKCQLKLTSFINDGYTYYQHEECEGRNILEIEEIDIFPCKFEGYQDKKSNPFIYLYIDTKVINLEDFLYFIKKIQEDVFQNVNFRIFFTEIKIFDCLKFKNDKNLCKIIRKSLISLIINYKNENYDKDFQYKYHFSSIIVKNILIEFLKIYFFSKKELDTINATEEIKRVSANFNVDFFEKNEEFIKFDSNLLVKVCKKAKSNWEFAKILNCIFKKIKIKKLILGNITEANHYIELPLFIFRFVKELYLFKCEDFKFLFNENTYLIFERIEIIYLIFCKISYFTENIFKDLKYLTKINILCSENIKNTARSEIYFISNDLLMEFYNEMSNLCKMHIFTDIVSNNKKYDLGLLNADSFNISKETPITKFDFNDLKYQIDSYYWITFTIMFITFDLFIFNYKNLGFLSIYIENVSIDGFFFTNTLIVQNIRKIFVVKSRIGPNFLKDILLLPKLKDINFINCKFNFTEIRSKFCQNKNIKLCKIKNSVSNNDQEILNFIKKLNNVEKISLKNNENIKWFDENFVSKKNQFENLFSLIHINSNSTEFLPNICLLKSIRILSIGKKYKEGSLSKIFDENVLLKISELRFKELEIGLKDKLALRNFIGLKLLHIHSCKFKSCLFSDIFDQKKEYFIEKLFLKKLVLRILDILFISKLKYLMNLHIDVMHIEDTNILLFTMSRFLFHNSLNIKILTSSNPKSTLNLLKEEFSTENMSIYFFYNLDEWFVS
ncbi:hypothetical protein CWI38_0237p0050 [Hamiltosporidium tvaerminnensis]|uniref:Uncharacterized protein n=1 Tax=Hamiltosporidium tvaerminnensis TaxID=1176355 RepID=A0A4Q9LZ73_9MICR|nr:hypothetical protein CWI38_0237p0050 [Hamiltosporidium tvaerminnensis]